MYVFATRGATLDGGELDGRPFSLHAGREAGNPVFSLRARSHRDEPDRSAALREPKMTTLRQLQGQALVKPLRSVTKVSQCDVRFGKLVLLCVD